MVWRWAQIRVWFHFCVCCSVVLCARDTVHTVIDAEVIVYRCIYTCDIKVHSVKYDDCINEAACYFCEQPFQDHLMSAVTMVDPVLDHEHVHIVWKKFHNWLLSAVQEAVQIYHHNKIETLFNLFAWFIWHLICFWRTVRASTSSVSFLFWRINTVLTTLA